MASLSHLLRRRQVRLLLSFGIIMGGCTIPAAPAVSQNATASYTRAPVARCQKWCLPSIVPSLPGPSVLSFSAGFENPEPAPLRVAFSLQASSHSQPSLAGPILGGLGGAVVGSVAGGIIGAVWFAEDETEGSQKALAAAAGFLIGVALGEPWGLACGVHAGNNRLGNALIDSVVSLATLAAGIGITVAAEEPLLLIGVPVLQLITTVAAERATAGRGHHKDVRWCPLPGGFTRPMGGAVS